MAEPISLLSPPAPHSHAGRFLLFLFMALVTLGVYAPFLQGPFVQDDWKILHFFHFAEPTEVITSFLTSRRLFFRPVAMLYHYAVYGVAGLNPAVAHVLKLGWMALAGTCVTLFARSFRIPFATALLLGLLWISSAYLLQDILLWMVGINEIFCLLFSMASLHALRSRRHVLGALALALALLSKESAMSVPLTLGLYSVLHGAQVKNRNDRLRIARDLLPYALVTLAYLAYRFAPGTFAELPSHHPYAMSLWPSDQGKAWAEYALWLMKGAFPWSMDSIFYPHALAFLQGLPLAVVIGTLCTLAGLLCLSIKLDRSEPANPDAHFWTQRPALFLFCWASTSVIPYLLIPFHAYRYYWAQPLVPVLLLAAHLAGRLVNRPHSRRILFGMAVVFGIQWIAGNAAYFHGRSQHPLDRSHLDGSNDLFRRAADAAGLQRELLRLYPALPAESAIVISNLDLVSVLGSMGPEIWYQTRPLHVWAPKDVQVKGDHIQATSHGQQRLLPVDTVLFLDWQHDRLIPLPSPRP